MTKLLARFLVFSLIALDSFAQLPTSSIHGFVKDSAGAFVPDASITASNIETGYTRTTRTAQNGMYQLWALPVGNYRIKAEHAGFSQLIRDGIQLRALEDARVDFSLQVGPVEQSLSVSASTPLITTLADPAGWVDTRGVSQLPLNGRNYADLALLQNGISEHKNHGNIAGLVGTWFSSQGAPVRSNNYLLDGAMMQNLFGTTSASVSGATLGLEGTREFRLVTNSPSAEYGMTMGSQVVLVSKAGTNGLHGSAFDYLRNDLLDARNFFDYQNIASTRRLPPFRRNNFGGSVGGPIRTDTFFYHLVFESIRERLGRTIIAGSIPTSSRLDGALVPVVDPRIKRLLALFPEPNLPGNQFFYTASQPTDETYGQWRLDWNFGSSDSAFLRYTVQDSKQTIPLDYEQFRSSNTSRAHFATASQTHIFSQRLLTTGRFSFSRTNVLFDSRTGLSGPGLSFVAGREMGVVNVGGVTPTAGFGPGTTPPANYVQNIFTISDDTIWETGSHSVKLGALINRFQHYILASTFAQGTVTFTNLQSFLRAQPTSYQAATIGSVLDRTYRFTSVGLYLSDEYRPSATLTLNFGLRYEFNTVPSEIRGHGAAIRDVKSDATTTLGAPFLNSSLRNFSPRFGFAWGIGSDGRTSLSGAAALLYDIGALGSAFVVGTTATPPFSSLSSVTGAQATTFFDIPFPFPAGTAGRALRTIDYNVQQPHMLQYNFALERELPSAMLFKVTYAGSRGINLIQTVEGNPTVPLGIRQGGICAPRASNVPFDIRSPYCWLGNEQRQNPNWGQMEFKTAGANSSYHSMQLELRKRLAQRIQFQSSYTWSKVLDEPQSQLGVDNNVDNAFGSDTANRRTDRGPAGFNLTHNWHFNAIYDLPSLDKSRGLFSEILNGWRISGIVAARSGFPFTPALQTNRSRSGVNGGAANIDRPDLLTGWSRDQIVLGGPDRYYETSAFAVPQAGLLGTSGRNILTGPGFATVDVSVAKNTTLRFFGDEGNLEFRGEFFNLLNRPNFGMPDRTVLAGRELNELALATAARIRATASSSRQIQLVLRLSF